MSKFFDRSPGLQVSVKDSGQCDDKSLTLSAFSSLAFKVKRQRFKVTRLPIADYSREQIVLISFDILIKAQEKASVQAENEPPSDPHPQSNTILLHLANHVSEVANAKKSGGDLLLLDFRGRVNTKRVPDAPQVRLNRPDAFL